MKSDLVSGCKSENCRGLVLSDHQGGGAWASMASSDLILTPLIIKPGWRTIFGGANSNGARPDEVLISSARLHVTQAWSSLVQPSM